MIYIGIDFGDRRIGIARSDGFLATMVCTIKVDGINDSIEKCVEKIKELGGEKIVIGLPKNMDSSEGFRAERTRRFGDGLKEATGIEPCYFDERLTTVQAYTYMNNGEMNKHKKKGVVDALSAEIILQDYLDSQSKK